MRAGESIPDRIANAPTLKLGLELFLQAFFELDTERNHSMGICPIAWSSMKTYSEYYEFDHEQSEDLSFFIRRMDSAHLKKLESKQKK